MKSPSILLSIVAAVTMTFGLSTSSVQAVCPPDFNGNNFVDGPDLAILLTAWNSSSSQYDLNNDGIITGADLAVLIGHWGPCGFGGPPSVGNTLVIDTSKLNNLPLGWSAWVVGWANVRGGCILQPDLTWKCYDFEALTLTSTPGQPVVATFGKPDVTTGSGYLQMIQIWESTAPGGQVWGNATITTGNMDVLSGAQLQIVVTPTNTPPTALGWLVNSNCTISPPNGPQCVTVTQMNNPPYNSNMATPDMQLFDIVEFTYIPDSLSTWDISGVNGLVVPMTMGVTQPGPPLGLVGIQPGISREKISTAYTTFMTHEGVHGAAFQQLLYWHGGGDAYNGCFLVPPEVPNGQFFAIPSPGTWLANANDSCNSLSSLNTYWDQAIDTFFVLGKTLKVVVSDDSLKEYTGVCSTVSGVVSYKFTNELNEPVLTLPKPAHGIPSASFVFSNINEGGLGVGDGSLIIDSIMEALNRGVYLDGLNPTPIPISTATSTDFFLPPLTQDGHQPNPLGVATITTTLPHGIPQVSSNNPYKLNIAGVSVADYNGTQPANTTYALNVDSATQFRFQYRIDGNTVNKSQILGALVLGSFDASNNTTPVTVTIQTPDTVPTQGEVVYFQTVDVPAYNGQHIVTGVANNQITINLPGHPAPGAAGGICWRGLYAAGTGGLVTPRGASTIAWNNSDNWYGAPNNPSHTLQVYNTYSKFLHYSTINGTDSRVLPLEMPIYINNQAYGFPLDEKPNGPYIGPEVPAKFDGTIKEGATINLTLSPWLPPPP